MQVLSDTTRDVVRHFRTIEIKDGPVVDAGEGPTASYFPGTLFKVDKLRQDWIGDAEPETVMVSGEYIGDHADGRSRYEVSYRAKDGYPEWIKNIL